MSYVCDGSQMIVSARKFTLSPVEIECQPGSNCKISEAIARLPSRPLASSAQLLESTRAKGYLDFPEIRGPHFCYKTIILEAQVV